MEIQIYDFGGVRFEYYYSHTATIFHGLYEQYVWTKEPFTKVFHRHNVMIGFGVETHIDFKEAEY